MERGVPAAGIGGGSADGAEVSREIGASAAGAGDGEANGATTPEAQLLEEDGTIVAITVSHGSLEEADYALMVATYEDETLSGAERFLDRQLNGLLSSSFDAGFYPGELGGKSLFLRPHPVVTERTSPPGAYIVGLGRSVDLTRSRVRHAVGQALIDRCLQLATYPADHPDGELREVGVSSTLLGVRNADGLSVTESVCGILEGVLDANQGLVRYEAARVAAHNPVRYPLRITALEFIERFAERADLIALVIRNLPNTVRLRPEYNQPLTGTVVNAKRGGLAAGAALVDSPENWRRFSITTVTPSDEPAADPTTMTFDVSFLGGDARADRTEHRLDRLAVDALSERLSTATDDAESAATLYDMLVPEQLRHHFLTSSSVQLIVDQTSANYPWELLSAPRSSGDAALSTQISVVRQFSETAGRRLVVERAQRGTALVIAAGKVPGQVSLTGAHEEGAIVAGLLGKRLKKKNVRHIDDQASAPDTVTLVNALDGNHQILHIASHGEYVADSPAATGALLNETFRLRVETVRQLRHVPDLVFLNCCYLGRVGTSRLAAGLAREFMAIGTRAVIAAGWDVGDRAAAEFAKSFYERFLDGATFADAVAAARLASMRSGGRETWAAYQCYGDPMLLFDGSSGASRSIETDPVSSDDLIRRLKTLRIQASDLGRPGSGKLDERRHQHLTIYRRLDEWARNNGMLEPRNPSDDDKRGATGCRRHLARVAAELGDFAAAADHYLALLDDPEQPRDDRRPRRWRRWASVEDLQQASNCLSRSAQRRARDDTTGVHRAEHIAELERAVELARQALDLSREPESYGILGGALKRLATVSPPEERVTLIRLAAEAYERRDIGDEALASIDPSSEEPSPYTRNTAAQLALLTDPSIALPEPKGSPATDDGALKRIDQRAPRSSNYWAAAVKGDEALTGLLASTGDLTGAATEMTTAYERAFQCRSTWRERASSIDHLRDLVDLLDGEDPRRPHLLAALATLQRWEKDHEETAALLPAITVSPATEGRAPAGNVVVSAIPAGAGDCLLVEYRGDDANLHRVLIDGGLGTSFDTGLGAYARAQPGGRLDVDVLVVTHIDNDHIVGAVRALEQGLVTARDVWFNGLAELDQLGTRGPKQGDQLSALVPAEARNRVVDGAALLVPDTGSLPVLPLPGGARCTLLTPNRARLGKLRDRWKATAARGMETALEDLEARIDQQDLGRARPGFGKDTSVTNASSIAFVFEHGTTSALFTGDAFAGDLSGGLDRLLRERGLQRLSVDLFKLSHHGSVNNITSELLERLDAREVLVCTDGEGHHPDEDVIRLLAALPAAPRFWFAGNGEKVRAAAKLVARAELPEGSAPTIISL